MEVKYFEVQAGDHPHDVAPAPDGSVWYTGQGVGVLGRLDPKSGQVERIRLGEGSAPHGVIVGPDGAAWVTDSGLNAILRVDPTTKEVKTWPYYVSLAGSFLGKPDLETGETAVIEPGTKGVGTRRIGSDSKGRLWVSEWNAGNLSVYDPTAKDWKVYKLPGDEPHAYAVYVDGKDKVWVSDFAANAVLRFDPETESFESFPSDKTDAAVRQMAGRPGEAWAPNPAPTALWLSAIAIKTGGTSRCALCQREHNHEAEQSCRGDRDDQGGKRPPPLRLGGWPRGEFHLTLRARSREQRRGMFLTPFWARPAHIV